MHIASCYRNLIPNPDECVFNVVDGSCRQNQKKELWLASFSGCTSGQKEQWGSTIMQVETSPHAKIRKGGGRERRHGGEGVGGCSWKTLCVPVILTGKEMTRKKKKKQENKRQLSDILRCYLLKRRSPQPPLPLLIIGCMLALRLNCAGFGSFYKVLWLNKDLTNAFRHNHRFLRINYCVWYGRWMNLQDFRPFRKSSVIHNKRWPCATIRSIRKKWYYYTAM